MGEIASMIVRDTVENLFVNNEWVSMEAFLRNAVETAQQRLCNEQSIINTYNKMKTT